jgi:hypothetical protein
VEQFGVLEGLTVEKLIERDHLKFYAWKAYGDKGFTYLGYREWGQAAVELKKR